MKLKLLLIIAIAFTLAKSQAQLSADEEKYLAGIMTKKVNLLRKKKGLHPLQQEENLAKAAHYHSLYMAEKQEVTHYQLEREFVYPKSRVKKYSSEFINIGENVLNTRTIKPPFTKRKLNLIANLMIKSWRNSPGHYKNIIASQYSHSDFGFVYNKNTKQIFATHVFGFKGYKIPNQLSDNAFGITANNTNNCSETLRYDNIVANLGNGISIEQGEVIFRYHNKNIIDKIFCFPNDGLAVDLITKDQIQCGSPNKLDASPIYDGIFLKPVYKNEILQNNRALGNTRLVVSLGKVPSFLKGKDLSANLVILKNNNKCSYKVPVTIPASRYDLIPIPPILYTPKATLKTSGIAFTREIFFDFENSKTNAKKITKVTFNKEKVARVDIKSYTSVDGTYTNNKFLFNKRASFIKKHLTNTLGIKNVKINTEAKENWELYDFQLTMFGFDNKLKESKKRKRLFANTKVKTLFTDAGLFSSQRKSKAILFEKGTWLSTNKNHAYYNLIDALLNSNNELANKALLTIYNQKDTNLILDQDFILDRLIHQKELVQNTSALIIKNIENYQIDSIIYYINYWLKRANELSKESQKNLLNLYTITANQLLQFWDVDNERFARILHPKNVNTLFQAYANKEETNPLYLNYHMTIIDYYGQINDYKNAADSFYFISNYFKKRSLSIEDDIKLALFFNAWSRYDLTRELLSKSYLEDRLNEEATFIFAQTVVAYSRDYNEDLLRTIQEMAIKFNKKRWCKWIKNDFQNLRLGYIKDLYCYQCNN